MIRRTYQVGGSLSKNASTYVTRQADTQLYQALNRGEFCYVLNCRQMGKSSLLVRVYHQLKQQGFECATIDMTNIGSQNTTCQQWYQGIIADLWLSLKLSRKLSFQTWWSSLSEISDVQKLSLFIEEVILVQFPTENICIFIDEIDSILSLNFTVDDFFALIRYCYNQRAINPEYNRLNFAIFGVATPADLIQDRKRTPFNIGTAIELHNFTIEEIEPLAASLLLEENQGKRLLKEILSWTGGQPFLTNKLCQLVMDTITESNKFANFKFIYEGNILKNKNLYDWQHQIDKVPLSYGKLLVENLVRNKILDDWQHQDEPEHLRTIQNRLLYNPTKVGRLLGIYQKILQKQYIEVDKIPEETELILSGLIVKESGFLKVKNPIYEQVFNLEWIGKKLRLLRPYAQNFDAWISSQKTDKSRLLRGLALKDAEAWARGKILSDLDYQYLDASVEIERKEKRTLIEAERIKEVEARLRQEEKTARFQRLFLVAFSIGFFTASGLGITTFWQYRNALDSQRQESLAKIKSMVRYSEALFALDQQLDSLIQGLKARRELQKLRISEPQTEKMIELALRRSIYAAMEFNHFVPSNSGIRGLEFSQDSRQLLIGSETEIVLHTIGLTLPKKWFGHQGPILAVAISPDNKILASSSGDTTIKLWQSDGTLMYTLRGHQAPVNDVEFSPDGEIIASSSLDRTIKLWRKDGTLFKTLRGHEGVVRKIAFSPDGKILASVSEDGTIKLWYKEGIAWLHTTIMQKKEKFWDLEFSPDGQMLAVGCRDGKIHLRQLPEGKLLKTITGHTAGIWDLEFSPDGKILASASDDKTIAFWNEEGILLNTIKGHNGSVRSLAFSPDGKILASAGSDSMVKMWRLQNPFLTRLSGHTAGVQGVAFSPDGKLIASVSGRETILWQFNGTMEKKIEGKNSTFSDVIFSPQGNIFAVSAGLVVQVWQTNGELLNSFRGHLSPTRKLAFSPDGNILASTSGDKTLKLWSLDGQEVITLKGHQAGVWGVAFNDDGSLIGSSSGDGTVRLWHQDGQLFKTFLVGEGIIYSIAGSLDGFWIGTGNSGKNQKIWSQEGELLSRIDTSGEEIWAIVVSPNGKTIATGNDRGIVKLWQPDGQLLATLLGHRSAIRGLVFSPDGKTLASAAEDKMVILWDLDNAIAFEDVLSYGCEWVRDYLETNVEVEEGDRSLCDDIN
ncbi:AAA-like domain-containing protein [Dapis sp. BLCC M126]|uniref:WD40 domain-containing protein n=1 Tax=Dapis sp. BLCC M126 TaxID=3400189 RepID=UPI003CF3259D